MLYRALFTLVLVCSLFIGSSAWAGEKKPGKLVDGTFLGVEEGDYVHFQIRNSDGEKESFIVLQTHKSVEPYLENPKKMKGRKVRVQWKEEMIEQAGQKMKTVVKIEEQK